MKPSSKERQKPAFIVGIDEVGRGPLAGPVAVCAVAIRRGKEARIRKRFAGIRDSKKLSSHVREKWAKLISACAHKGELSYCVCFASNTMVDRRGIAPTIRSLVSRSLYRLKVPCDASEIFLDGGLKAPKKFALQKTIIRGDDTVLLISMASVAAKVARDRRMEKLSLKFRGYGFEAHKGYGTKTHRAQLEKLGPCALHRLSFLNGLFTPKKVKI